jgi:hypothetical protein
LCCIRPTGSILRNPFRMIIQCTHKNSVKL